MITTRILIEIILILLIVCDTSNNLHRLNEIVLIF